MNDPVEKTPEEAAKLNQSFIDIFDNDDYEAEYAAFVESMIPYCHCARNRPCDGVLAGGICDDIQEDRWDELFDEEDEV